MDRKKSDEILGFLLLVIAGKGGNWLITPMRHPDAGTLEYVFTWVQIIVCLVVGLRLLRKAKAESGPA